MKIKYTVKTAIKALKTNKSRTALTILGIVIGITAIMMVMSLGQGVQNLIMGEIQSIGAKTVAVHPGRQPKGMTDAAQMMFSDSLKERDLLALQKKENVPYAAKIEPLNMGAGVGSSASANYNFTIFGSSDLAAKLYDFDVTLGRFLDGEDVLNRADVVVIGSKVKEELFGNDDALGQKIKVKSRSLKVIGILPKKGQSSFINFDESVFIPWTTAQQYIFGVKHFNHIMVEADSEEHVDATVKDVEATLRISHGIDDPEKDDFYVVTQASAMEQVNTIMGALTSFLAAVAAISLLVGGVGIMNIMLVSVTERTREIGLRKALGATKRDILTQFLLEAITLTATGGIIGIMLGSGLSFVVAWGLSKSLGAGWLFSFPVTAALLGLGVASLVGLVFGIYPARQAASKSPIEALRYE